MTQCEWGSCHVSLVFPLKNAEESFPAWNGGFLLAESEYECGPRGVIMVASLCTFIVPLALSFLFFKDPVDKLWHPRKFYADRCALGLKCWLIWQ